MPGSGFGFWRSRAVHRVLAIAAVLGVGMIVIFTGLMVRSTDALLHGIDLAVLEQLELLSARPPSLLPFMIRSRMDRGPGVLTHVGLFEPNGRLVDGDIPTIPQSMPLDEQVYDGGHRGWAAAGRRMAGKRLEDGRILIVARDAGEVEVVRSRLFNGMLAVAVALLPLSLAGAAAIGLGTGRRLRRLNRMAEQIIAGDLHHRLPTTAGGDELDRLCAIMNRILDRFEEGLQALAAAGENVAHDLRTPLTTIRAGMERLLMAEAGGGTPALIAPTVTKSIEQLDRALSLITAILRIADIKDVRRLSAFAPVSLSAMLDETVEVFRPVAEEKGLAMHAQIALDRIVVADRPLLVEALVNLLENAIKFTPPGGQIVVSLRGTATRPLIEIRDTGPGIPISERSAVFRRFYRGDTSRATAGSGLGLSLVQAIFSSHGFRIRIGDGEPGCRIDVECWQLPRLI